MIRLLIGLLALVTPSCIEGGQYGKIVTGEKTSSSEKVTELTNHPLLKEAMPENLISIDAVVNHVMESWPLQLSLQTSAGDEQVALAEETIVKRAGVQVDPGAIQPGQRVRVIMRTTESYRIVIELNILD